MNEAISVVENKILVGSKYKVVSVQSKKF